MSSNLSKRLLMIVTVIFLLASTSSAWAIGRVQWSSTKIEPRSDNKAWKLEIKVFLPRAPDFAHMPVKFEFLPTVYYERSKVDGDEIVERKVPLVGRQPMVESVELGFLDPGTGEIQSRTRFSFKLRRDRGFDSGEYKVTIRDGRTGNVIGSPTTIALAGENKVIDRRSMDFSRPVGDKKKDEGGAAGAGGDDSAKKDEKAEKEEEYDKWGQEPEYGEDYDDDLDYEEDPDAMEEAKVKENPGACGCRTVGGAPLGSAGWVVLLGLGLLGCRVGRRTR